MCLHFPDNNYTSSFKNIMNVTSKMFVNLVQYHAPPLSEAAILFYPYIPERASVCSQLVWCGVTNI